MREKARPLVDAQICIYLRAVSVYSDAPGEQSIQTSEFAIALREKLADSHDDEALGRRLGLSEMKKLVPCNAWRDIGLNGLCQLKRLSSVNDCKNENRGGWTIPKPS